MRSQDLSNEQIAEHGTRIYDDRLRHLLDPGHNGQGIAISLEDGDHEVAPSIAEAHARLRTRRPDAVFFYGRVGDSQAVL